MTKYDDRIIVMLEDDDPLAKMVKRYKVLQHDIKRNDPKAGVLHRNILRTKSGLQKKHDKLIAEVEALSEEACDIIGKRYEKLLHKCTWYANVWYRQRGSTAYIRIDYDTDADKIEKKVRNSVP